MKSVLKYTVILLVMITAFSFTKISQTTETVTGVFKGLEDYGYSFLVNKADKEFLITFHDIEETLLEKHDLTTDLFLGETFKVTYTIATETIEDEEGNEVDSEFLTIIALEKK
jgi:hypothetical protein